MDYEGAMDAADHVSRSVDALANELATMAERMAFQFPQGFRRRDLFAAAILMRALVASPTEEWPQVIPHLALLGPVVWKIADMIDLAGRSRTSPRPPATGKNAPGKAAAWTWGATATKLDAAAAELVQYQPACPCGAGRTVLPQVRTPGRLNPGVLFFPPAALRPRSCWPRRSSFPRNHLPAAV